MIWTIGSRTACRLRPGRRAPRSERPEPDASGNCQADDHAELPHVFLLRSGPYPCEPASHHSRARAMSPSVTYSNAAGRGIQICRAKSSPAAPDIRASGISKATVSDQKPRRGGGQGCDVRMARAGPVAAGPPTRLGRGEGAERWTTNRRRRRLTALAVRGMGILPRTGPSDPTASARSPDIVRTPPGSRPPPRRAGTGGSGTGPRRPTAT